MVTTTFSRRLSALENAALSRYGGVGSTIFLEGEETLADACRRLDLPSAAGHIVVPATLEPEQWSRVAREQQRRLLESTKSTFANS